MRGLVVYRSTKAIDAIDEFSRRLADALIDAGQAVTYECNGLAAARRAACRPSWVLLQYMPFSYGRWGIAPGLIRDALLLKRTTGALFGVMVHEAWVPMDSWRNRVMGGYQRLQLRALLRLSDAIFVSTEYLHGELGGSAVQIPVGSNITPTPMGRSDARASLGIGDELVVALFGTGHPHRALDHAEAALEALLRDRGPERLRVLNLGAGAQALRVPRELRVDTPGMLAAEDVSRRLRASDVLLMPFSDGVSTRRTTLMAGLAHGLAVVGLYGHGTDSILTRHPDALTLTPVGDPGAFASAAVELTRDTDRLMAAGRAARTLYERQFDWPVAARRLIIELVGTPSR